ncbi:MAG: GTPase Era [Clostridia bacterium]|nr:GTPase Era [Clostridia bacterium]MBQ2248841.1 GTPase Era [Clostridia bacterium]MBQ5613160.1 GTPase Era [Clostridia bacterium]MBQ5661698.1 GTPase Era [Clostridia bacterium]MBQ5772693.1 GTPase Era [Clostridia bacterium]
MKRTGFITIVGRPNVGKSTLLNAILGEKIAIVSSKPQTTRNRIAGIETRGEDQFVFLDTPGIFKAQNSLGDFMVKTANSTMQDGDAVILVADAGFAPGDVEEGIITYLKRSGIPGILALNKVDLYRREQIAATIAAYAAKHDFFAVVPISAKKGKYVDEVLDECSKLLREGEWFYDEDMITDQSQRQMAAEAIREKILRTVDKEIPHGVAVTVEEFVEEETVVRIRAEIFCEKASHKGILVGKNGETLKRIGSYAREDLERLLDKQVYLNLWVKVKENWRDSQRGILNFGYTED